MEQVDIVDENLKILFTINKLNAHNQGLLHPTITAEVKNSQGEYLLVKQASHKQDAGKFVSPVGGHIKSGESEIDALKREALEEVGLKNFSYKRIGQTIYKRNVNKTIENHFFIIYEIYSDEKIVLNDESVEYKWFSVEEIKKILKSNPRYFGDAFFPVIKNFYKLLFLD